MTALLCLLPWLAPVTAQETPRSDLVEEVRVRYVLLDALVVDSRGKAVPGLGVDDFKLYLDWKPYPIQSVDVYCPPADAGAEPPAEVAAATRGRIVLALDYRYVPQIGRIAVLERLEAMIRSRPEPLEPIMIAALTHRLRIEQPFTSDRARLLATLARMKHDAGLWQPALHVPMHAVRWLESLKDLIRLLADFDGLKSVVLIANLPATAGGHDFTYDPQFEAISSEALDARTTIYATQASGLTLVADSDRLRRLALDTGGRYMGTNDPARVFELAARDTACRYAIGFYDRDLALGRVHRVSLSTRTRGLRVLHPSHYRYLTEEEKEQRRKERPYAGPGAFLDDTVRGELLAVGPLASGKWEAAVVMRFAVDAARQEERTVEFGFLVDDPAYHPLHHGDRTLTVPAGETGPLSVVAVERVELAPGSYDLSVVVVDPADEEPRSAFARFALPEIPRRGIVVGEPLLTRPPAADVAVHWEGDLVREAEAGELVAPGATVTGDELTAITRVCRVGRRRRSPPAVAVTRRLVDAAGAPATGETSTEVELNGDADLDCTTLVDELRLRELAGGLYRFDVALADTGGRDVTFRFDPPEPPASAVAEAPPPPPLERAVEVRVAESPAVRKVLEGRPEAGPDAAPPAAVDPAPRADDLPPLDVVLDRLTDVATLYETNALRFTAEEETKYWNYLDTRDLPAKMRLSNVYFYYLEHGVPMDRRIRKSAMRKLKQRGLSAQEILDAMDTDLGPMEGDYGLRGRVRVPYFVERPYSLIQLFSSKNRPDYRYTLEHADEPGHVVVRLEPQAADYDDKAWFATALVDLDTFQIVRAEGQQGADRREELAFEAMLESPETAPDDSLRRTFVSWVVRTEFGTVHRGLRFPSQVSVTQSRHRVALTAAGNKKGQTKVASELVQSYHDYRFFDVETWTEFATDGE